MVLMTPMRMLLTVEWRLLLEWKMRWRWHLTRLGWSGVMLAMWALWELRSRY